MLRQSQPQSSRDEERETSGKSCQWGGFILGTSQLLLSAILSPRLSGRSSLAPAQSCLQSQSRSRSRSFRFFITALSLPHSLTALSTARLQPFFCPSLSQPQLSLPQQLLSRPQPFPQPQLPPQPPKQDNKRIIHKQFIFFTIWSIYCILCCYPETVHVIH